MTAAVIVPIITAAAEAFAGQVAQTVGAEIAETLFNQKRIASDLDSIKRKLAELSDFIRNQLPHLIDRAVDAGIARKVEFDIVEKAISIKAAIAALSKAQASGASPTEIRDLVRDLVRHADDIAEMGGALISYGQPYYASVAVSFAAMLTAYAAALKEAPYYADGLGIRATSWQSRIDSWLDPSQPASFSAVKGYWEYVYAVGAKVIPTFETFRTGGVRRVAYTYTTYDQGGDDGTVTIIHWAWFGLYKRADGSIYMDGNHSGSWISAPTLQAAMATVPWLTLPEPEWWDIEAHNYRYYHGRAGYDQMVAKLANLRDDYYHHYHVKYPVVCKAVDLVTNLKQQLIQVVGATTEDEPRANPTIAEIDERIAEQRSQWNDA